MQLTQPLYKFMDTVRPGTISPRYNPWGKTQAVTLYRDKTTNVQIKQVISASHGGYGVIDPKITRDMPDWLLAQKEGAYFEEDVAVSLLLLWLHTRGWIVLPSENLLAEWQTVGRWFPELVIPMSNVIHMGA